MTAQSFPVVQSRLDLRGQIFQANRESWKPVLDRFEAALRDVSSEGTEASLSRHQERGQLLGTSVPIYVSEKPFFYLKPS